MAGMTKFGNSLATRVKDTTNPILRIKAEYKKIAN